MVGGIFWWSFEKPEQEHSLSFSKEMNDTKSRFLGKKNEFCRFQKISEAQRQFLKQKVQASDGGTSLKNWSCLTLTKEDP